jgi:integrase
MRIKTATQATTAPAGVHGAGSGLYLKKTSGDHDAGSWIYRYRFAGRRREMGLGQLASLSLAEAREAAVDLARAVRKGDDPIEARRREKEAEANAARAKVPATFRQAAEAYLADYAPSWKHRGAVGDWLNPLARYAYPIIGDKALDSIEVEHVRAVIRAAIRAGAPETGRRVRQRIEAVLDDAELKGERDPAKRNPADVKAHAFAKRPKGDRPHYRRLELDQAPRAFAELKERAATSSVFAAWAFMIATAARPGEALGARWDEIDRDKATWTVPAARMKGARAHVVPLNTIALAVLDRQANVRTGDAVFPGRSGSPLAYSGFSAAPIAAGLDVGSPHGWRSIFRDCCGDILRVDRDLAEAALAHALGGVEGSYRRQSAIEARRPMMEAYARWLTSTPADNVIELKGRG